MSVENYLPDWIERKHIIVIGVILLCVVGSIVFISGSEPSKDYKEYPVYNQDTQTGYDILQYAVDDANPNDTIIIQSDDAGTLMNDFHTPVTIKADYEWKNLPPSISVRGTRYSQFNITAPTTFEGVTIWTNHANAYGFNATSSVEFNNSIINFEEESEYSVTGVDRATFTETKFEAESDNATINFTNVETVKMTDVTVGGLEGIVQFNLDNSTLIYNGQTVNEDLNVVYLCSGAYTRAGEGLRLSTERCSN
jgi:hypothetical protein